MKFSAPQNVPHMFRTEFVFQLEMSALNEIVLRSELLLKRSLRDSTPLTSHVFMGVMVLSFGLLTSTPVGAFPQFTPVKFNPINSTSFEKACVELPRACADIDTPGELFELVLTPVASNATCGFFRYIYPVPWLFDTLYPPARALYLTYPPYPPLSGPPDEYGNNCACPPSSPCGYQWQCIVLGSGYWLLESVNIGFPRT